jgi:hypothetical protein
MRKRGVRAAMVIKVGTVMAPLRARKARVARMEMTITMTRARQVRTTMKVKIWATKAEVSMKQKRMQLLVVMEMRVLKTLRHIAQLEKTQENQAHLK